MGGAPSFKPFTRFFLFFFVLPTTIILLAPTAAGETPSSPLGWTDYENATGKNPPPPPPPSGSQRGGGGRGSPFKPSVVVLVGVMTTLFFLTFLLLLYVKHCKPEEEPLRNSHTSAGYSGRKNSGIDRVVIESLPIFRFGSLRGQKEGLECAVCLTPFESVEVLRLLPKCKHAFHVECVDTWLDAHSTCPLCRYRVDPEDILLVGDAKIWPQNQPIPPIQEISENPQHCTDIESGLGQDSQNLFDSNSILRRVSGRHSSVGERGGGGGGAGGGGLLKIIFQHRISVDGETTPTPRQKKTALLRMSLDSAMSTKRKRNETGKAREGSECDGARKDGLLLTEKEKKHRVEHRIIVSPSEKANGLNQRWSDVQPSDLLYLTSEMILSESRSSSGPSLPGPQQQNVQLPLYRSTGDTRTGAINVRSLSEITGLSRTRREEGEHRHRRAEEEERQAGVVSRWLAWISQSQRSVR
ncbi:RING-H2 finger protein ATL43-like [Neltuma alba]|uniref:RING-H2 finger protein ATL43-like n=1 Tax=Neltuma alba TaxID=207710 RepID=UPI0010A3D9CC|nr:RING-H2 finger protein ATL43-like [Prosopis alba]